MIKLHAFVCAFILALTSFTATGQTEARTVNPWDQWNEAYPSWVAPFPPFRIIGNIYFVGTEGLSSFLVTSPTGHILIDGGLPQNAPMIAQNIRSLGFNTDHVKIMLNSHAHFDHSGGLNELKDITGAKLLASEGDRSALEGGFYLGYEDNTDLTAPPVRVDEVIQDGSKITLGSNTLIAHITPGHTRGCTSFTATAEEDGQEYSVLFFCGATVAGNTLVPEQYEGIIEDYRDTFVKTASWQPDVMLVNHPFFFDMIAKREKQIAGNELAFINKAEFPKFVATLRATFEQKLKDATEQKSGETVN